MSLLGFLKGFLSTSRLSEMARGYLEAALWAATDEDGYPLDRDYSLSDFSTETVAKAERDCQEFASANAELYSRIGIGEDKAGHLFWLVRTGSGVSFTDDFKTGTVEMQIAKKLDTSARKYGEAHVMPNGEGELDIFTG